MAIEINKRAVLILVAVGAALIYLTHGYWWNQTSPGFGLLMAGDGGNTGLRIHRTWHTSSDLLLIPEHVKQASSSVTIQESHITFPFENKDTHVLYYSVANKHVYRDVHVLLLNGEPHIKNSWRKKMKTLSLLGALGFKAVAVDLPVPEKQHPEKRGVIDKAAFLQEIIKRTHLSRPVLVSPSMSGGYSLPYIFTPDPSTCTSRLAGYMPIAPILTDTITKEQYAQCKMPVMIVYGENDRSIALQANEDLINFPNHEKFMIPMAGHAAYIDDPEYFHNLLYTFLVSEFNDDY